MADGAPLAIEARGLAKTFQVPNERATRLKELVLNPLATRQKRPLRALDGVSFEVQRGEFFGIVGRNGSGKSTLLKILASIYAPDAGTVRMSGLPAPFIELGVGFNMELTARENVELNGVLMGLDRRHAKDRLDAVLEFAELEEFVDMKLKNYSSGMLVRLAFSVMIQSDAEILLIDEVLAVGDAAFQQKCADVFHEMRDSGRTVVLVTHDMAAVEKYCHRAMLLSDGEIELVGAPDEVARRYLRLNFEGRFSGTDIGRDNDPGGAIRVVDAWLEDGTGTRVENVEAGSELRLNVVFEASEEFPGPSFGFVFANADAVDVFGFGAELDGEADGADRIGAGERVRVSGKIENRLTPGRYSVKSWVYRNHSFGELAFDAPSILDFVVFGVDTAPGVVSLAGEMSAVRDPTPPASSA